MGCILPTIQSMNSVTFTPTAATLFAQGPLAVEARSILNPDSLPELSCQVSRICEDDRVLATNPLGAVGGDGFPACTEVASPSIAQNASSLFRGELRALPPVTFRFARVEGVMRLFIRDNFFGL